MKYFLGVTSLIFAQAIITSAALAADNKNVSLILGVKGSPFYQALQCGAQAKARELGLNLTAAAPDQFAADSQILVVNAVAATKPAVAIIVPTDTQALIGPMKQLDDMGIKLITVDATINDTSFIKTQVLTDNSAGGKLAADTMNELLGGKGSVIVITHPPGGSAAQDARVAAFEQQLKRYSGIQYLGPQYQSDNPQKAAEIVTSTLSAHPDLAGIFATNDQGAIGTITGLRQVGMAGKIKVVAYDAATAEVDALKNGTIHALIAQNPKLEGEVAMQKAAELIDGKTLDKVTMTETVAIRTGDHATADKYEYKADCM
jgi:ribose transport system substrate-binding protein